MAVFRNRHITAHDKIQTKNNEDFKKKYNVWLET